mmetsp:Transcript_24378/g.96045  ORF Transcript_24378/g.96045 Transcript_24378/m.96045 type:complete len:512 (-) Transcript_24378:2346-3881(-)
MAMSGGVDVGAAVIDCGSFLIRGGLAGEDSPRALVPSAIGTRAGKNDVLGHSLWGLPELVDQVVDVYGATDGLQAVPKWDVMKKIVDHVLSKHLMVSSKETPLILVEPSYTWGVNGRAAAAELAFEGMGLKSFFIARGPVMAAFSAGRSTSLVVDVGHQGAFATAVFEGYALEKSKQTSVLGGRALSDFTYQVANETVGQNGIRARYELPSMSGAMTEKESNAEGSNGVAHSTTALSKDKAGSEEKEKPVDRSQDVGMDVKVEAVPASPPGEVGAAKPTIVEAPPPAAAAVVPMEGLAKPFLLDSKKAFYRMQIVHDLKQSALSIREIIETNESEANGGAPAQPATAAAVVAGSKVKREPRPTLYTLPDGTELDMGQEICERIPESLFDPKLLSDSKIPGIESARSLHRLAYEAASACDIDVRRELFGGLVLSGGCSLFPGVAERFQREVAAITPQMFKLRMVSPSLRQDRASAPWVGGSILGSLGTFQQMWMSKQEYDEHGAMGINRKCP